MSNQKQIQALQFEVLQKLGEIVNLVDDGKSKTVESISYSSRFNHQRPSQS
ncbi:hypothetical protein [Cysteiniphilum litorale]|uniref:hypothetical protein n=1 Tax=Cysteiniphilum litorale TaxID=2056700 RepID=UPI003F884029